MSAGTPSKRTTTTSSKTTASPAAYAPVDTSGDKKREHIQPVTQTIPAPSTSIGRSYSYLHPALLLLHFSQRFGAVVTDPVPALARDLAVLGLAQGAYAVLCLPPTSVKPEPKDKSASGARRAAAPPAVRGRKKDDASMGSRISTAVLALLLSLFAATPVFFILMVLLGAPLTTHHPETLLCAAHLALLFGPPLFYTRGVDPRAWREVAALLLPGDAVWGGSLGTLVGAWLGAVPIPLDWDRDWQRWPVTIVVGAYMGWALGRLLGEFVLPGRRVPMEAE